jgi:uncharacterized repeat protein (TIGR03803 family)
MKLRTIVYLNLIALVAFLSLAAHAQTFSVIHSFNGADGKHPDAGVTLKAGVLYGTTFGGAGSGGTIYQMKRQGSNWTATPIYVFTSNEVGENPWARVVFGPDGHLYGTTSLGGDGGAGTAFNLVPPLSVCKAANCMWKPTLVHGFSGGPDGLRPGYGDLVWDQQGNIYGTTELGGALGTVFQLTPSGNTWTETIIHNFTDNPDGAKPYGGLVVDNSGNLFGTTSDGGAFTRGVVFELSYVVGVGWQETILYNFNPSNDGGNPFAGLLLDNAGNFYGSTTTGGPAGGGTVFELSRSGNGYTFNLLYSFSGPPGGICGPYASLTMDAAGSLYGTTLCDGANQKGNVFKLTNTGNGWTYTSLYDFTGGADSDGPISNVTIDSDGTLYGTAGGGNGDYGVVWMIKP